MLRAAPRLLEIGCNTDHFLAQWAKEKRLFGLGLFGADINEAAAKAAGYKNISVMDMQALKFVPMPVWVHVLVRNAKVYNSADYTAFSQQAASK